MLLNIRGASRRFSGAVFNLVVAGRGGYVKRKENGRDVWEKEERREREKA